MLIVATRTEVTFMGVVSEPVFSLHPSDMYVPSDEVAFD